MKVVHIPGKSNAAADALSRAPVFHSVVQSTVGTDVTISGGTTVLQSHLPTELELSGGNRLTPPNTPLSPPTMSFSGLLEDISPRHPEEDRLSDGDVEHVAVDPQWPVAR